MKIRLFIESEGLERLALGQDLWSWHFRVKLGDDEPSEKSVQVAEAIEVFFPDKDTATRLAVESLREKRQQIFAEAARAAQEVEEKIQNLLALEAP